MSFKLHHNKEPSILTMRISEACSEISEAITGTYISGQNHKDMRPTLRQPSIIVPADTSGTLWFPGWPCPNKATSKHHDPAPYILVMIGRTKHFTALAQLWHRWLNIRVGSMLWLYQARTVSIVISALCWPKLVTLNLRTSMALHYHKFTNTIFIIHFAI